MIGWEKRFAIVCAVAGIVVLFVAGAILLVEGRVTPSASYSFIAAIALLVGYAVLDPAAVRDLVGSRQARFGTLSVVVTAVLIGILVLVNVVASRGTQAADLTRARFNTLAPQSVKVVRALDSDVQMIVFYRPAEQASVRTLLNEVNLYRAQSPHVKVRTADFDADPAETAKYGAKISGDLVILYKGKSEVLTLATETEQDITGALIRLQSSVIPVVCWAVGEGERSLRDGDDVNGYSQMADSLTKNNFKEQDVLLAQVGQVPAACSLVVLMAPQKPLTDAAIKAVREYVDAGGKLLVAADPWIDLTSLNNLMKPYGMTFSGGLVVEGGPQHASNNPTTPAVVDYGSSPMTKDLNHLVSFYLQPTAIDSPSDSTIAKIAQTTGQSYEVKDPRQDLTRQGKDRGGPFPVIASFEKDQGGGKKTRIVAFATGSFAANIAVQANAANLPIFLGSLQWLSERENLIAIPPKPSRSPTLFFTAEQASLNRLVVFLLLPLVFVVGGLAVWYRRRRSFVPAA